MQPNFDIYVINLDKDTERFERIRNKLAPNHFERVSAIYGEDVDITKQENVHSISKYITPKSVVGCNLSHRKAMDRFLNVSVKPYVVIIEDDAEPVGPNYMTEIAEAIEGMETEDWDVIKLDYLPDIKLKNEYTSYKTFLTTAYILNKPAAKKILEKPVYYHYDVELNLFDLRVVNNPKIIFKQTWDETNGSHNQLRTYNPLSWVHPSLSYKIIRLGDFNITIADIVLLFILISLISLTVYNKPYNIIHSNYLRKGKYFWLFPKK
jgi:hypothetical protein